MSQWTPEDSAFLSLLLDSVTGTKEGADIRQDYCRLHDCVKSNVAKDRAIYYTGSKAEGLDLPGSDLDYMYDLNGVLKIKVVQSLHECPVEFLYSVFYLCTENTPPGFALLRCVNIPVLIGIVQSMNGQYYLSSDSMVTNLMHLQPIKSYQNVKCKIKRQGPSLESWINYLDEPEPGMDMVSSIHCAFWPRDATEWIQRNRQSGWPTQDDISSVVNFGCHVVPVGHPKSKTKSLEWRISFSVAERTLVWSFNHVQLQCYALMKIILKEFIKIKCSPQNQVLCSYFIKTFLFWQFENKNVNFWQENNLRECLKHSLIEFSKCLNKGVLKHYFFPTFNLLSIKLTPEAKKELTQLYDIIIQSDVTIIRECKTLRNIWSVFVSARKNHINLIYNEHKKKIPDK